MKKFTKPLIIPFLSIIFIILFVHVSTASDYTPLTNREPIVSTLGFSITPPRGNNWYEQMEGNRVFYLKKTDPKYSSFYTAVFEFQTKKTFSSPKDFLEFVKSKKNSPEEPNRFKNANAEYKLDESKSPFCVRYNQKVEDHGAKNLGTNKFLYVENQGLMCLHPDAPNVGVDIFFSDRYVPGRSNTTLKYIGEEFINDLKFISRDNLKK